jgi:hypothetical protein
MKVLIWIFLIGLIASFYALFNLRLSYKYEVDLQETHIKTDTVSKAQKKVHLDQLYLRKVEIEKQENQTYLAIYVLGAGLLLSMGVAIYRNSLKPK